MAEIKYWHCGDFELPDIEEFVDEQVGLALKEFIVEDGYISISWWDAPEPSVIFLAGEEGEFVKRVPFYELLVDEIGQYRPGGADANDLFFDPQGDRRAILMQELLRTYQKWKAEGVHVPEPE
jgi:hypothetical protein